MKTNFLLSQHCRCKAILEMIQECDKRMKYYRQRVEELKSDYDPYDCKRWYLERWHITLEIKERLARSYAASLAKIIKPTVDKILQTT